MMTAVLPPYLVDLSPLFISSTVVSARRIEIVGTSAFAMTFDGRKINAINTNANYAPAFILLENMITFISGYVILSFNLKQTWITVLIQSVFSLGFGSSVLSLRSFSLSFLRLTGFGLVSLSLTGFGQGFLSLSAISQ